MNQLAEALLAAFPRPTIESQQCCGKQAHDTKEEAEAHLRDLVLDGRCAASRIHVYRCQNMKWHVGHRKAKR